MEREDLLALSKEELVKIILRLLEANAALAARVAQLEDQLDKRPPKGKSTPDWAKPNKPKAAPKPSTKKGHRGFGRKCEEPTQRVQHAATKCPDCGRVLRGGWVKRRRQVLHIPIVTVRVIEHEIIARRCPKCHKEVVPKVDLSAEVVGRSRVSLDTMSMIATMSEEGRVPLRTIQRYLEKLYHLKLSLGELQEILHLVARRAQGTLKQLKEHVRASPVVHGDETGMRENGQNGYIWSFSTPDARYFEYKHSRSGEIVTDILGDAFEGCLVSDFYGGYKRMEGRHQRCWTHLLRDIHELTVTRLTLDQVTKVRATAQKPLEAPKRGFFRGPEAFLALGAAILALFGVLCSAIGPVIPFSARSQTVVQLLYGSQRDYVFLTATV